MPFATLPLNDGLEIPELAFGTGTALRGKDARDAVDQALENGIYHIDTAQGYANEESVGQAIRDTGLPRSDLYITTKFAKGTSPLEELRLSLKKLGVSYVDLYLIHHPQWVDDIPAAWKEFEQAKSLGLTRSIGVSNFSVEQLKLVLKNAKVKPAINQINYNPYNNAENADLLSFAALHGIVIEAYSSLTPITQEPGGPVDKVISKAAERLNATPAQVIFLWVRAKGAVIVTTTSKKERISEYLEVGDLPSLTEEEISAIDKAGATKWGIDRRTARFVARKVAVVSAAALVFYGVRWTWF